MICGGSRTCGCSFQSESLNISNDSGLVTLETFGPAVVTSGSRPTSPFMWQHIFESDTGFSFVWDGSEWQLQSWIAPPACVLAMSTTQLIPFNVTTLLSWNTEVYDPHGWHSAGAPNNIVPTLPGLYQLTVATDWQRVADYSRALVGPFVNAANPTPLERHDHAYAAAATWVPGSIPVTSTPFSLDGNDIVTVQVYQTNAASAARTVRARMTLEWKAPI